MVTVHRAYGFRFVMFTTSTPFVKLLSKVTPTYVSNEVLKCTLNPSAFSRPCDTSWTGTTTAPEPAVELTIWSSDGAGSTLSSILTPACCGPKS